MKLLALSILIAAACAGCAAQAPVATSSPGGPPTARYTGEVWNWDEEANVVTLRRGTETIRVQVAPGTIAQLRLHETATITGVPAPPVETPLIVTPPTPMRPVPRGPAARTEVAGTVRSATPDGRLVVETTRGPLEVQGAQGTAERFQPGKPVSVRVTVQPLDMVPAPAPEPPPSPIPQPAASVAEPGDYAVVIGRVLSVDPAGSMTVEAPQRPITVWVPDATRYRIGETVEVRTFVAQQ